jgi:hypothetical protein
MCAFPDFIFVKISTRISPFFLSFVCLGRKKLRFSILIDSKRKTYLLIIAIVINCTVHVIYQLKKGLLFIA